MPPSRLPRASAALLLLLAALAGCRNERNLYRADRVAPILTFEIKDARNEVLWKVWNRDHGTVSDIRYRATPPGFIQEAPAGRERPRDFRPGEPLTVFVAFADGWCRTSVTATGADRYRTVSRQCAQLSSR